MVVTRRTLRSSWAAALLLAASASARRGAWGVALGTHEVYLTLIRALIPFRGDWAGVQAFARAP